MDPIADMFAKIKNAQAVKKEAVLISHSKIKAEIAKLLLEHGYIKEISRRGKKSKKNLELILKYDEKGKPAIVHLSRVSKPSRRVYLPFKEIKSVRAGAGAMIFSTPKGLLTDKEARREKVGGEVIGEIW
jgi:small subunit ribosomal protein S8